MCPAPQPRHARRLPKMSPEGDTGVPNPCLMWLSSSTAPSTGKSAGKKRPVFQVMLERFPSLASPNIAPGRDPWLRRLRSPAAASLLPPRPGLSQSLPHSHSPEQQGHHLRWVCACPCSDFPLLSPAAPQNCLAGLACQEHPEHCPGHHQPLSPGVISMPLLNPSRNLGYS